MEELGVSTRRPRVGIPIFLTPVIVFIVLCIIGTGLWVAWTYASFTVALIITILIGLVACIAAAGSISVGGG